MKDETRNKKFNINIKSPLRLQIFKTRIVRRKPRKALKTPDLEAKPQFWHCTGTTVPHTLLLRTTSLCLRTWILVSHDIFFLVGWSSDQTKHKLRFSENSSPHTIAFAFCNSVEDSTITFLSSTPIAHIFAYTVQMLRWLCLPGNLCQPQSDGFGYWKCVQLCRIWKEIRQKMITLFSS